MPDMLRHVSIHGGVPDEAGYGVTVDVSLPAAMSVGELLPWMVDALGAGDGAPRSWRLSYLDGHRLDESATLAQNDVRDGDLLVLTADGDDPPPDRSPTAALAVASTEHIGPAGLRVAACLWACGLGAVALAWAGLAGQGPARGTAGVGVAAAVTAVAVAAPRFRLSAVTVVTLNVVALVHVAVLGFLIVPAGPAPANFFLAATAAGSSGALLMRVSGYGTEILLAVVAAASIVAAATGVAVLWPVATPVLGAVVSVLGVGLLPLAPRLSIALAGLTPPVPEYPGAQDDSHEPTFDDVRAQVGHRHLVSLVTGCAAATALGTAVLTFAGPKPITAVEVAFAAAVGVALLLRSRTYASVRCRTAVSISGSLSLTAAFILVVARLPAHGSWVAPLAVGIGIAAIWPITIQSPVAVRIADAVEYGALAAVVPLACWLAGAFDVVRDLALT